MPPIDISAPFGKAVAHHKNGQLLDALASYDAVLRIAPNMAAAHCNRGLVLQTLRRFAEALQSYDSAVRLEPTYINAWFNRAITLRLLNRLEESVQDYERVLAIKPDHAQAFGNRGNVLLALNRPEEAIASYDRAIALNPKFAEAHSNRGSAKRALDRLEEALEDYSRAAELAPGFAQALCNKGCALRDLKRPREAIETCDRAIAAMPGLAEAHFNRANALQDIGRSSEALESYKRALEIRAEYPEAWNNRGYVLKELDRPEEAILHFDRALALNPRFAEAHSNRGNALRDLKRYEEAIASCERAIALKPDLAGAYHNKGKALQELGRNAEALASFERALAIEPGFVSSFNGKGNALEAQGRLEEALASYDEAIARKPDFADAWTNRGNVLKNMGQIAESLKNHDRAIELNPDFAEAHWNKSICALLAGDFETGWPLYEWRKRKPDPGGTSPWPQPDWAGDTPLDGKTLYVHAEQGFGDTIQFCRFALLAREQGAKVILAVQDPLARLLQNLGPGITTIPVSATPRDFDYQAALMSLPLAFGTGCECSVTVPYLHAEGADIERWCSKIGQRGFKIGICWQGNRQTNIDAGRSFPLGNFEAISAMRGVRLISLQKKDGLEQLSNLPEGMRVETLSADFDAGPHAFVDTAAAMMSLDLVITSDTAIAHLAGALGRPVWVVLQYVPDWRWLLGRSDSPWYPTMRLFRQKQRGDWTGVFSEIETELRGLLKEQGEVNNQDPGRGSNAD